MCVSLAFFCVDAAISSSVGVCYFAAAASASFVSPRVLLKAEVIIAFEMSGCPQERLERLALFLLLLYIEKYMCIDL